MLSQLPLAAQPIPANPAHQMMLASNVSVTRSISGSSGSSTSNYATVRGTVRYVDTNSRTIELEQTSWLSGFTGNTGGSNVVVVQYDPNTRVDVSGQLYPVTNLERGDVVEAQIQNTSGGTMFASRLALIRNVRQ